MDDIIYNPIFKDTVRFIKTSVQTEGKVSELEVKLGPKGGNPLHRHKAFAETFTAISGYLGLTVNGNKVLLKPGERITVQKGEVHQFFNPGSEPIKFNIQFTPGHTGAENMLRIMYGLARDGKTNSKGIPKNILVLALVGEIGDSALAGIMSVTTPIFKAIATIGRKKGIDKVLLENYCQ
jgi:mannose-6-phosphate isomerase-like protein (cupin superfamily)